MSMIGEVIGDRYELRGFVMQDGFDVVCQAYDRKREREVWIKWHEGRLGHGRALLVREARLLGLLAERTSGTLVCHELEEHGGVLFQVMEHVRGVWLQDWERQELSRQQIARMYAHLAQVLHEIHAADVVIRDLKPAIVMVLEDDHSAHHSARHPARIKLCDLALAVQTTEPDVLTGGGSLVGTVLYMSPEVIQSHHATSASDVFALGCMLVEALTGQRPWPAPGMQQLSDRLSVPPALYFLYGSAFDALLSSMLAVSPEERLSAAEVARALASFADT